MDAKITLTALLVIALAVAIAVLWSSLTLPAFAQEDGIGAQVPPPHHEPDHYCIGRVHNPHKSEHDRTTVNVIAETRCEIPVSTIQVTVRLQKGWGCVFSRCLRWSNHGPLRSKTRSGIKLVKINSAGPCENGHYRGLGTHFVVGLQGISERTSETRGEVTTC